MRSQSAALMAFASEEDAKAQAQTQTEPADPADPIEENRQSLDAFVQANAAVLDGMAALSAEMLSFGNKRLSANIERSQTLAGCQDIEQAFKIQQEFFESAVQQYLDQANQVMTIMATINRSLWTPLEELREDAEQAAGGNSGAG